MMESHEHTLSDLLEKIYERFDMTEAVAEMEVRRTYHGVVGELISKLTKEVRFKNGTLSVKLLSPALRNELEYKKQDLQDAINERLRKPAIKKIILR